MTVEEVQAAVRANPVWYHTIEVAPGVVTPGYFDLRPVVDRLPWPDVEGKRCLDVGTYDGFYAFELERRGAAEVVAADVEGPDDFDWPPRVRDWGPDAAREASAGVHAGGFPIAKRLLGSTVERVRSRIYDLSPESVGEFDVVTIGSLLIHLRDPHAALEAVRRVCRGYLMSAEEVDFRLTLQHRRSPVARLDGASRLCQWWKTNPAGHRQMLHAAGFDVERTSGLYAIPYGPSHAYHGRRREPGGPLGLVRQVRVGRGLAHQALLARPAI